MTLSPTDKSYLKQMLSCAACLDDVSAMLGYLGTTAGVSIGDLNEAFAVQWWSRVVLARREARA